MASHNTTQGSSSQSAGSRGKPPIPTRPSAATDDELDSENEQTLPMMHRQPRSDYPDPVSGGQQQVQAAASVGKLSESQLKNNITMGEVEEQPSPTGMLAWLGFGTAIVALACLGISFASPFWFQTYPNSFNQFQNMGLWEICFDNYMHHKDDSQEIYNGCWWVFTMEERYWKLREWLLPPWFISVQVMVTASFMIEVGVVVASAMIFLHFCPIMNHEYHQTYAMFAVAALQFLAVMISLMGAVVYGAMCGDRQWMPRPDLNFLSWGYGFLIIFDILALTSGVCFFLEARKAFDELMRRDDEYTKAVLEMSHGTMPMGQSYGAPSYAPSYGAPSYGQPDYSEEKSYERKPSVGTQPSYGGQSGSGYGGQPAPGYNGQGGDYSGYSGQGSLPAKA